MADSKISDYASATLPLSGDELVEVVQGGVNKKTPASSFGAADYPAGNQGLTSFAQYTDLTNATPYNGVWIDNNSNGALSIQTVTGRVGVIRLTTGTNAAGRRHIATNHNALVPQAGQTLRFKTAIRIQDALPDSDGGQNYEFIAGFFSTFSADVANGHAATFRIRGFAGGAVNLTPVVSSNLAQSGGFPTGLTVPSVGTWAVFEVVINGDTDIQFYLNGTLVWTAVKATLSPSNAWPTSAMQHGVGIRKISGTTARAIEVDWLAFGCDYATRS